MPTTREPPGMDPDLKKLKEQRAYSFLSECLSMGDFARRCRSCDAEIEINPFDVWKGHVQDVYWSCIARENDYYRSSKGLIKSPAKEIDDFKEKGWILRRNPGPYNDYERLYVGEFIISSKGLTDQAKAEGWILRRDPGPYNDYERLYVGHIMFFYGELFGEYSNLFLSYDADLALRKCYKLLQSSITWDTTETEMERQDIVPFNLLAKALQETLKLKRSEQEMKERVPLYTKLFQEVVRKKRGFKEVLIEIKENNAASFPLYSDLIEGKLRRGENLESLGLEFDIDDVERYINAATKGEQSEQELICRYYRQKERCFTVHTYGEYLEKKMQMAVKLGIITNIVGNNNSSHNNSCSVFQNHA